MLKEIEMEQWKRGCSHVPPMGDGFGSLRPLWCHYHYLTMFPFYFIGVPWTKEVAMAETKIDGLFSPDANIQKIAEAYALDALDAA